ncbi:MAG: (2Fe-2S)-binding protein [Chromatiales bacterium]|jgi:bacterioferritin-associated ferredoxin
MYVCVCNSVTDGQIRDAVDDGICTMEALCSELKVSSCCGRCSDCARKVLHQALAEQSYNEMSLGQQLATA